MSSLKVKLDKRIDKIVGAIDISGNDTELVQTSVEFPGWSWKCDAKGKFLTCSDEVFDCLGITPNEFINKSLITFRLTNDSSCELGKYIAESNEGGNIVVSYEHADGKHVVVNLNLAPQVNSKNEFIGWSGFNQVIEEIAAPPVPTPAAAGEPVIEKTSIETQPTVPLTSLLSLPATEPLSSSKPPVYEEEPFALSDYFMILLRRRWVVLMTFFFTMLIVASILSQMPSQYTAKTIVRVTNPRSGSADYVDYNTELGQRLLGTYVEIANGEVVKQQLSKFVDRMPTINAEQIANSELFEITAEDPDPGLAQFAANKLAEIIIAEGAQRISTDTTINVYIAEAASLPSEPSSASPWLLIGLAAFVGLLGGSGLAFIFENLDTRLYSDKQIESLTDLHVVGNIPDDGNVDNKKGVVFTKRIHNEAFQRMRTNIFTRDGRKTLKTLLITSPVPRDGKSTVVVNFALNLTKGNRSVCLLDANLRFPSIHTFFDIDNQIGLSDVLEGRANLEDVTHKTGSTFLSVIPSGSSVANPVDILDSDKMREVVAQLEKDFEIVLIDSPASTSVTDPAVLSSLADGVLLVVRHGWVRQEALTRAIKYLKNVDANIVGVVSNRTDQGVRAKLFQVASRKSK
ncbi:MAG: polysaccharide biosynthesis tyrosine autokinase [Leptolinea sp.]|nr:polysaccharide biosynthesis tyrosine autokinase [Leptolinea sp.]